MGLPGSRAAICGSNSAPGQGTTVRLYLPRVMGEAMLAEASSEALAPSLPGGDEAILVVDDNDAMRATAVRTLGALGYRVQCAADGPAGLALLRAGARFDLLLTDVVMPNGMNGYQLAAAARVVQPGLAVLFATGFAADTSDAAGAMDAVTLRKPYRRCALAERVRAALDACEGRAVSGLCALSSV